MPHDEDDAYGANDETGGDSEGSGNEESGLTDGGVDDSSETSGDGGSDSGAETDTDTVTDTFTCDELEVHAGDLMIGDSTSPDDVRCVERVMGSVHVENTSDWTDLRWLNRLRQVDADVRISGNAALVSLAGLSNLESVGGSVVLEENPVLVDIRALAGVRELRWFAILDNASLTDLKSLQGDVHFRSEENRNLGLVIAQNQSLASPEGLGAVDTITADDSLLITVLSNDELVDLQGLGPFGDIGQVVDLHVTDNPKLQDFGGSSFGSLREVWIEDLPSLTSLAGIDDEAVVVLRLGRLDSLTSLEGLENVREVGQLDIGPCGYGNARLTSLAGLDNLSTFDSMSIVDNPALADISALGNVAEGFAWLWIVRNENLPQSDAEAFAAQLDPDPVEIELCGNGGGPPCDPDIVDCPPQ